MRIPEEGTDHLINRNNECRNYLALKGMTVVDEPLYIDSSNGYKLTRFIEESHPCDAHNFSEVLLCMNKLRSLHEANLYVDHEFSLFDQIEFYESLWPNKASAYSDYETTKKNVMKLRKYIEQNIEKKTLCHIDAIPDNFLLKGNDVFMIDWEYSGMQDPHIDIAMFCIVFVRFPEKSNKLIQQIRFFLCNDFGTYYLAIGLFFFIVSLYIAFSGYGKIVLGQKNEQPKYKFWPWSTMMFTCGLAADILFYFFSEWLAYASDPHIKETGHVQEWSGVYPLFHWGFIPWSFYLVLAVSFGFMLHVRKRQNQKYSEACRPLLKNKTDGPWGRLIDLTAVFSLIAGTATTFSVATPLISTFIIKIFSWTFHARLSASLF